jgi:hypothetical protein
MRTGVARRCLPCRLCKGARLLAASLALCVAGSASAVGQPPDASPESTIEPERSRNAHDEPSFFVLPIRTELQRRLIANGKPVNALIELNGFITMGKKGVERMRALDILAVRRALAAIKTRDPDASVVFMIGFLGETLPGMQELLSREHELLTKECRDLAKEAKLRVTEISGAWNGTPAIWPKVAAAAQAIDVSKETDREEAATDAEVRAYPVRTKVSELLTSWFQGSTGKGSNCVVYFSRPIDPTQDPLIGRALEARTAEVIKRLNLSRKERIDYHLVVSASSHAAWQRNHDAIHNRFIGKEAIALTQRLGFKDNSVTW